MQAFIRVLSTVEQEQIVQRSDAIDKESDSPILKGEREDR